MNTGGQNPHNQVDLNRGGLYTGGHRSRFQLLGAASEYEHWVVVFLVEKFLSETLAATGHIPPIQVT